MVRVNERVPGVPESVVIAAWSANDLRLLQSLCFNGAPCLFEEADGLDVGLGRTVSEDREHEAIREVIPRGVPLISNEWVSRIILRLDGEEQLRWAERLTAFTAWPTSDCASIDKSGDTVLDADPYCHVPVQKEQLRELI